MMRSKLILGLALGIVLGAGSLARAQYESPEELRARLDRQDKQIHDLTEAVRRMQGAPSGAAIGFQDAQAPPAGDVGGVGDDKIKKIAADVVKEKDKEKEEKKKADEAAAKQKLEEEGYRVNSDLSMKATWLDGVVISTPNGDDRLHIGGWVQYDNVFYGQSGGLLPAPGARPGNKQGVASGIAANGIGDLQDGTYFRRIRLQTDGVVWQNVEYMFTLALENDQFETIGLDEFWMGVKDIPWLGTVRFGHVKTPMGFEADMTASSKSMTFMERSSYSEAIELNQNFVTGLWMGNNYFDQHATWSFAAFRQDQASSSGVFFGDGQFGLQGRLTALPLDECEGRHLLHLGVSGGWRNGTNNLAVSPIRTFQLRARPELRDDDPSASAGLPQNTPNANSNRMIDTGLIAAQNDFICGTELFYVLGPLSVQGEYGWNWLNGAFGVAPTGFTLNPKISPTSDYMFQGGYLQLAYTLTGENRSYDRRLGRLDSTYFGKQGPLTNAWCVEDENGHFNWGLGAWEIAARYSFVDLNSGFGLNRIQGGAMDGLSVGLNWYFNNNFKLQFDYVYNHRFDVPVGTNPGDTTGYGMRAQFQY
jgi:phosphate-selective porin OprO/OprP